MGDAEIIRLDRQRDPAHDRQRCRATTSSGRPCRNFAADEDGYCRVHARAGDRSRHPSRPPKAAAERLDPPPTNPLSNLSDFLKRRLAGDYKVDDFGYDEELSREMLLPLIKPLFDNYFRVKTLGIDRIPSEGPALLVGNHSGTIPLDAVMMMYAVASEHPRHRPVRNVGADLVFRLPFVGPLARKTGTVLACDEDAEELLRRGELVGVFPEGYKGTGKGWRERYRLQRFGRGGFIETALKTKAPIVPIAIVGAEEAYPMIADLKPIARAFGFPYFPVTPTWPLFGPLGALPLPSRWIIEFGEPISMDDYAEDAHEDKMLVFDLADEIRDRIQQMLYRVLKLRGGAFL